MEAAIRGKPRQVMPSTGNDKVPFVAGNHKGVKKD